MTPPAPQLAHTIPFHPIGQGDGKGAVRDVAPAGQSGKGDVGPGEDGRDHNLWRQHNAGVLTRLQLALPRRNVFRIDVSHL